MTESIQLSQFEFIRASGPDARTFLQGQVTCDTTQITPTQSVLGALCNLKGRVIADFRAAQVGEDIVLKVGTGLAEPVLAVLKKYAVFSKLTLSKDDELAVLGLLVRGKGESDAEGDAQSDTLPYGPHAVTSLGKGVLAIDAGCSDEGTRCVELWGNGPSIEASAALLTSSDARTPNKAVAVATISDWTRIEI